MGRSSLVVVGSGAVCHQFITGSVGGVLVEPGVDRTTIDCPVSSVRSVDHCDTPRPGRSICGVAGGARC